MLNHLVKNKLILIAIVSVTVVIFFFICGIRINVTNSFPLGLYKLDHRTTLNKNDVIMFCAPKNEIFELAYKRGYIFSGSCSNGYVPLQKKIVGMSGDIVEFIDNEVYVNGSHQFNGHRFQIDSNGKALPQIQNTRLNENELFVMSDYNEKSFDSRYFGAINKDLVLGHLKPILIFR